MKLIKFVVLIFLSVLISCRASNKFDPKFYKKSDDWDAYLAEIGTENTTKSNTVFLIMRTTECVPCSKEIEWWNKNSTNLKNRTRLILLEPYKQRFTAYLARNNITLKALQDSASKVLKNDLIPTTPVKVYFNRFSKITAIDYMGGHGNLNAFLKKIRDK